MSGGQVGVAAGALMPGIAGPALTRKPGQLLLAFFGEYVCDRYFEPVRASLLLSVLDEAGVAAPAVRTNLDRMVTNGLLARHRIGREIAFDLTPHGNEVLREASVRVHRADPFDPIGDGWTLVTFSVPEHQRALRHSMRAALTWAGFAPLRDGLWIAPGGVDLGVTLDAILPDLPPGSVSAFAAHALDGFPVGDAVRAAWDIDAIRRAHEEFLGRWQDDRSSWRDDDQAPHAGALAVRTMLVADWLALLRTDPRLPRQYMDADWPADRTYELYTRRHRELAFLAVKEFSERVG